jgi:LemA protein
VSLRGVAEAYPALRATENFQRLQADLTDTEDQIQGARRIYNANVRAYNTKVRVFPSSLVAASAGFHPREFFEVDSAAEREPVRVSFD